MSDNIKIRIAILDLNNGFANQGMRCIHQIIDQWEMNNDIKLDRQVFDVRVKNELPDTSFDIYISSGGPGDPISTRYEDWDISWNNWLKEIRHWNDNPNNKRKKYIFFI